MTTYNKKRCALWESLMREACRVVGKDAVCEWRRGGVAVYVDPMLRKWDAPFILTPDVTSAIAALKTFPDKYEKPPL